MDILQFKLYKEIYKITDSCNTGSLKYRKVRKNTLKQIASDAIKIKLDLKSFSLFNIENFYVLLEYWKQTHNSDSTILNKRSVLIWYLGEIGVDIDIPKPKQLGLSKKNTVRQYALVTEELKHKIHHSICRTILDFQLYFGLARVEAVKLPYPDNNEIYISSSLSHNNTARYITVINNKQKEAIKYRQQVLDNKKTLLEFLDEKSILGMYNYELRAAGIDGHTDIRKYYLQQRIIFLEKCGFSEKETFWHIQDETGLKSKENIKKIAFS